MKKSDSIYKFLEKYINSEKASASDKIPSENKLAAKFGISRNLVREAMSVYVGNGLLKRIQGKGTFLTGKTSTEKSFSIGTVLFSKNALNNELITIIDEICFKNGYKNTVEYSDFSFEKERTAVEKLINDGANGIIIYPAIKDGRGNNEFFEEKIKQGVYFVFLDRNIKGLNVDAVLYDNFGAGLAGTQYLLDQGYRKIAFIGSSTGVYTMEDRKEGYKTALKWADIQMDDDRIYSIPVTELGLRNTSEFISKEIINDWKKNNNMPDAIFAANGALTLCAYTALYKNNIEITLLGFDEYRAISSIELPIPTLQVPCIEMARTAAGLVIQNLEGKEKIGTHQVILPVQLCTKISEKGAYDAFAC